MTLTQMKTLAGLLALGAVMLGGCGPEDGSDQCNAVCAKFNECPMTERDHNVDCASFCREEAAFEVRAEVQGQSTCNTEFNAYLTCMDGSEICDAEAETCVEALDTWQACVQKFCNEPDNIATDPACLPDGEGSATPALYGF